MQELPWKTLLDTFACTECGRCNDACPAHATGKPLKPMKVVRDVKVNLLYRNGVDILRFRNENGGIVPEKAAEEAEFQWRTPLISKAGIDASKPGAVRADGTYCDVEGQVHTDEIWACTTCAGCVQACPVLIDSVPGSLLAMRQSLVMMESDFPAEATTAFKGMEVQGNPWGVGQDRRLEWAEGLDVPVMAEVGREVEYLFWVGCAGATDPRARKTTQALVADPEGGEGRLRGPRTRGEVHRRPRPSHGQRVPLPAARAGERRDAEAVPVQEDPRDLPALPEQPRQRLPRARRCLRGRPPHAAARRS